MSSWTPILRHCGPPRPPTNQSILIQLYTECILLLGQTDVFWQSSGDNFGIELIWRQRKYMMNLQMTLVEIFKMFYCANLSSLWNRGEDVWNTLLLFLIWNNFRVKLSIKGECVSSHKLFIKNQQSRKPKDFVRSDGADFDDNAVSKRGRALQQSCHKSFWCRIQSGSRESRHTLQTSNNPKLPTMFKHVQ